MKLVCFCNNTAGGLVCDLLNQKKTRLYKYKTTSAEHRLFKVGDNPTVQFSVDRERWNQIVEQNRDCEEWVGTHCHPSGIPDLGVFEQILVITTTTRESMLYRWLRYYNGWFKNEYPTWIECNDLGAIDKIRELAKNVFVEYPAYPGYECVEFSDIVTGEFIRDNGLCMDTFNQWRTMNPWLNDTASYQWGIDRFNEAEWELTNHRPFKYI